MFDAFDFDKIPFYLMSTEEKELCVSSIESAKSLTSPQYALEFMEKTNSLIEKLELTGIKNSTYHDRYISLINRLNTFTEKTLDFILNHPFIGLNTNITTELLNKDMFEYYVISKTLFNKNFAYEPEKVSNDIYVQIYKTNRGNINQYMQKNISFLNMLLEYEYFKDIPNTQIKDLYKLPQTESFIRYVFEKTSSYDLREYLNSVKTFNGMDAKRVFVDLICDPKYIKTIDSIPFKDSLLYKIKESGLNRKFGRTWKKYWDGRI